MDSLGGWLGLWLVLSLVPATIAVRKGYSFWGFFILGVVALPVALVVSLVLQSKSSSVGVGSLVRVVNTVRLKDGGKIPARYASKVHAVDVIDGHVTVEVDAPDGSRRWIARSNVEPA
ncbi:MAG: hypothetical protein KF906_05515 [Actinobacteria bacterium]|nr:hypothetical protein [Actinomycetota bacterium]